MMKKINRKIDKLIEKIQREHKEENNKDDFEEFHKEKFQIEQPAMDLLAESLNNLKFN